MEFGWDQPPEVLDGLLTQRGHHVFGGESKNSRREVLRLALAYVTTVTQKDMIKLTEGNCGSQKKSHILSVVRQANERTPVMSPCPGVGVRI